MVLEKKCLEWVAGHLFFTCWLIHSKKVVAEIRRSSQEAEPCRSRGGICGNVLIRSKGTVMELQLLSKPTAFQLLTMRSVLKI